MNNKLVKNVERIAFGNAEYPAILTEIKNPPKELYCIGNISLLKERCAAVVGSRNTTGYGRTMAVGISKRLAEAGIVVVSGMARGIDTCAHRGALDAAGKTIAVLGCGVNICYPTENSKLKEKIEEEGLVISEYLPDEKPRTYYFPQRNRIISGLCEITVVVQARNDSGALITAELAAEQGREVYAVLGNIDSSYNMGSNKLIKDGATPIINISDVLEAMSVNKIDDEAAMKILSDNEMKIYRIIEDRGEMTVDELCMILKKEPAYIRSIITVMELKGTIFTHLGKIFIAKG